MTVRDVVVVGAGPAGSATALHLARAGLDVELVERSTFDEPRVGESLAPAVQPLLRELGVWKDFLGLGLLPSWGTRSLWGSAHPQTHSHLTSAYGCGWHVDRRAVDEMLARAAERAGAALRTGTSVTGCVRDGDLWHLRAGGSTTSARVVVDATGRPARVARMLGADRVALDRLLALAVTSRSAGWSEGLLVETCADGWWYSAPLPSGQRVTMLMTDADLSRAGRLGEGGPWWECLDRATATAAALRGAPARSRPQAWSAASHRMLRRDAAPWIAVGDAALAVDPVSGSGVLRALRTAAAAATAVLAELDHGASGAFAAYEDARDRECSEYLVERARYYAAEDRWDTPFWQRRAVLARAGAHALVA